MKYFKHFETVAGKKKFLFFQPEGGEAQGISIPEDPDNMEHARMTEAVQAGEAEIIEIDDTPVPTWSDTRIAAYGSWREQLDMMYHGTWKDHVASVKAANPKE